MRIPRWFLMIVVAAGCADFLGPDRGDPAKYAFATAVYYYCRRWEPALPTATLGLFDIVWGRTTEGQAEDGPRAEHVRRVVDVGGTIVHRYNVIMVRAVLPLSAVPALQAEVVRGVTNSRRYDVNVFVAFRGPIDTTAIVARGGAVTAVFDRFGFVWASVPDAIIPGLRLDPRVSSVESSAGAICALDQGASLGSDVVVSPGYVQKVGVVDQLGRSHPQPSQP